MTAAEGRAREWHHARQAAVCDVLEPWEHGTVARATRYPSYYDFNLVRVEDDPGMGVDELAAFADRALDGLEHRRVDFDVVEAATRVRPGFERAGWMSLRLLMLRHETAPPPQPALDVAEVPYDAVRELRVAWHREDFPNIDPGGYHQEAREVAVQRGARVLAVHDGGAPIGFAQLEGLGDSAEITQVYVHPAQRGGGLGTALTVAAIHAAGTLTDLWIAADDEDRPKELYQRLGFRPAWTMMEFTRLPR